MLYAHCQHIGRDPKAIKLSGHVWLDNADIGATAAAAAALGEQGLDLAIIYLPPPHDPAVLAPLAQALSPLR